MNKRKEEKILMYNFSDEESLMQICSIFKALHIQVVILKPVDYCQKIGYLLKLPGFSAVEHDEDKDFDFNHEVLVFYNIKNKRLDEVLKKLRNADIEIIYKAVVTPLNRFWSLERLCLSIQKEHGYILEQKSKNE